MQSVDPNRKSRIAVVIPAFLVETQIAEVLRGIPEFVSWIVVVDDCSSDDTGSIVEAEALRDLRICLLRHGANQGVGGATLTGYEEACRLGADIVVKMDGDGQMDPRHLPALIKPILLGQADYTKGNRFLHARQLTSMPLARRVGNLGLSFLNKLASGYWSLFDPTNGYTAIHASLIPMLSAKGIARRYFFESSMLLELSLLRAVVRDVYVPARYGDEVSNLSPIKTLCHFPTALFKGFLRRLWIQHFVRDFSIASLYFVAGLALFFSGTAFGAVHWYSSARLHEATPTGTVMLATLAVMLGVQFLLHAIGLDIQDQPKRCLHLDLMEQYANWDDCGSFNPSDLDMSEKPFSRDRAA